MCPILGSSFDPEFISVLLEALCVDLRWALKQSGGRIGRHLYFPDAKADLSV